MAEQLGGIKMLRIDQVTEKVGYKESTIYDWMNPTSPRHKPHFPLPRKNGRSNRWFESEIDDFCINEFGESSNHPTTQRGRVGERENAALISPVLAGEMKDDGAARPRKPSPGKITATESIPNIAEPQLIPGAVLPEATRTPKPTSPEDNTSSQHVDLPAVSPVAIPRSSDKSRTTTMTQTDASGKKRTVTVEIPRRRRVFLKSD